MSLSKSKYTSGIRCPKMLWLNEYKSDLAEETNDNVFQTGNEVGDLARHLFGDYVLIDFNKGLKSMIIDTQKALAKNEKVICEASFAYQNYFCSVDILKNEGDGYSLYEVKSSTDINDLYLHDIGYQVWLLEQLKLKIKGVFLVCVNDQYVKNGELDIHAFFKIMDVKELIHLDDVQNNCESFEKILHDSTHEPDDDLSISCHSPYDCPYFNYCTKDLDKPNIFDVRSRVSFPQKIKLYHEGLISYPSLLKSRKLNAMATEQIKYTLEKLPPKINLEAINNFLNSLMFPLYFLDFESYQAAIPMIDGTKPYQQICFQYSLHYYTVNGRLEHREFLSSDYHGNPMLELCQHLCQDIPLDACILVYNDAFEKTRLQEMANLFPEFHDHLLNIREHIVDLLPIFRKRDYYSAAMEGSASIKKVLPALFPNDISLDYHQLDQVHKGDEASAAFLSLPNLSLNEQQKLRENMLKYCALDTYAMVKIYDYLHTLVQNNNKKIIKKK